MELTCLKKDIVSLLQPYLDKLKEVKSLVLINAFLKGRPQKLLCELVPQLESLEMSGCEGVTYYNIIEAADFYGKQLKSINLDVDVTEDVLIYLANRCPNLVEFHFRGCELTNKLLHIPGFCPNINKVCLARSNWPMINELCNKFALHKLLTVLNVNQCSLFSDVGLRAMEVNCRLLEEFHCNGCFLITDEGITSMINACQNLQVVDVGNCWDVTSAVLYAFPPFRIKRLNLDSTSCEDVFLGRVSVISNSLRFNELRLLSKDCIVESSFYSISLFKTKLTLQEGNSGYSLKCLQKLAKNLYVLELYNPSCEIKDQDLIGLVESCPSLHSLSLVNCYKVTDVGFTAIAKTLKGHLKKLVCEGCVAISDDGLEQVLVLCGATLTFLNVKGCVLLTSRTILNIQTHCPKAKCLM